MFWGKTCSSNKDSIDDLKLFKELIENPIFNSSKWSISLDCMLGFVGDTLFNQNRMGYEIPGIFILRNITV